MRRTIPLLFSVVALILAGLVISAPAQAATTTFVAGVTGFNEVPAVITQAQGQVQVTIDDVSLQVCVDASDITNLTGPITADHIHQGAAGVNGPVVVNFNAQLVTCVASDATTIGNILADPAGFYVNFHTAAFPGGEVRGQLGTSNITTLTGTASGDQEVPPNAGTGGGPLTITIDSGSNRICLDASGVVGLTGPVTADHIHQAPVGVNGPIMVSFNALLVTCVIHDPPVVAAIIANPSDFYFNLHTQTFPGGEVRAQLALQVQPTTTTTSTTSTTTTSTSTTTTTTPAAPLPLSTAATPVRATARFAG